MTQHIKTHFKEKGANSLIANGALTTKINNGELYPEEIAFITQVFEGRKRFEDPDNPFLKFPEEGQNMNDGSGDMSPANRMNGGGDDREGSPEPEDIDDDDEEGDMIIDEDAEDNSFQPTSEGEVLINRSNGYISKSNANESSVPEDNQDTDGTIDP